MSSSKRNLAKRALVKVADGRGFVVQGRERMVITAGHCLPGLPPCISYAASHERTYPLLGSLRGPLTVAILTEYYSSIRSRTSPCSGLRTVRISMRNTKHTRAW